MAYSANQNAGGLETLTDSTIASGDLFVVGDVSDSNRAKTITLANLETKVTTDVLGSYVAKSLYDANTILFATSDNTPVALTVGTSSVVGRVAGAITTLAIDTDLSSVSASDDTVPSAKATKTALDLKANDADVVHDTGTETIAGVKTFSSDPLIPDEAYGSGWNGVLEPPTKNAVYDKIETLGSTTFTVNADETQNTWFTWTVPLVALSGGVPAGFSTTGTFTSPGANAGGAGVTTLAWSAGGTLFNNIPGNGSNLSYTAASNKDIKVKLRFKFTGALGSNQYGSFGFTDAATNLDAIQTDVSNSLRFILNNATLYAASSNNSTTTATDISASLTYTDWNIFEIILNPGTDVRYYVNGTLVATHTTIPTGALDGFGFGSLTTILGSTSPVAFSLEM